MKNNWKMWILVGAATALTAGCSMTNTGATASGSKTTLTVYISGDVNIKDLWQSQLIPLYQKSHPNVNFNVVLSTHGINDNATIARLAAGVKSHQSSGIDILEGMNVDQLAAAHLVTHLTPKDIPMMSEINPSLLKQVSYDGVPYRASSVVLAYNSQFVKNPPKTIDQLITWIKNNPGKFTYNSPNTGGSGDAFVKAVVNSLVPTKDSSLFISNSRDKTVESTWGPGLKLLHDLNPYVYQHGFYPNGNMATINLLANQSIWVAPVWSDQSMTALAQHQLPPSIKLTQLNPPFSGGPADLAIPANSPHKKEAEDFINWLLQPNQQTIIANELHGYPGIEWKYMPQSIQQEYASIASSYATSWNSFYTQDLHQQWQAQVAAQTVN
jgi:putative spermidine/putrescine transport system substrate-binding protein